VPQARSIGLLLLWLLAYAASGQNLVPNPSFEERKKPVCQFSIFGDNISNYLQNWYTPTGGTSDVWTNDPSVAPTCTQFLNFNLIAPRTGNQCAGLYTHVSPGLTTYREYVQIQLKEPLRKGAVYRAEMYVALLNQRIARPGIPDVLSNTATNNLGMFFSRNPVLLREFSNRYGGLLDYKPQVNSTAIITEDKQWVRISGCFVAEDTLRVLTIGNFFSDSRTNRSRIIPGDTARRSLAYYLIDDVSVEEVQDRLPQVELGPDTTLCNRPLTLAFTDTDRAQYRWQDGSTRPTFTVRESGKYWVQATRAGCVLSDTVNVTIEKPLKLPGDTILCRNERLTLTVNHALGQYRWSTGSTQNRITIDAEGTYSVVVPSRYCAIGDTIRVEMVDCPGPVPNVFTPNGDGRNETFYIENIEFIPWELEVFNRWGQRVHQASPYANGWTGDGLPTGTYYYRLRSPRLRRKLKGWVELIR